MYHLWHGRKSGDPRQSSSNTSSLRCAYADCDPIVSARVRPSGEQIFAKELAKGPCRRDESEWITPNLLLAHRPEAVSYFHRLAMLEAPCATGGHVVSRETRHMDWAQASGPVLGVQGSRNQPVRMPPPSCYMTILVSRGKASMFKTEQQSQGANEINRRDRKNSLMRTNKDKKMSMIRV